MITLCLGCTCSGQEQRPKVDRELIELLRQTVILKKDLAECVERERNANVDNMNLIKNQAAKEKQIHEHYMQLIDQKDIRQVEQEHRFAELLAHNTETSTQKNQFKTQVTNLSNQLSTLQQQAQVSNNATNSNLNNPLNSSAISSLYNNHISHSFDPAQNDSHGSDSLNSLSTTSSSSAGPSSTTSSTDPATFGGKTPETGILKHAEEQQQKQQQQQENDEIKRVRFNPVNQFLQTLPLAQPLVSQAAQASQLAMGKQVDPVDNNPNNLDINSSNTKPKPMAFIVRPLARDLNDSLSSSGEGLSLEHLKVLKGPTGLF